MQQLPTNDKVKVVFTSQADSPPDKGARKEAVRICEALRAVKGPLVEGTSSHIVLDWIRALVLTEFKDLRDRISFFIYDTEKEIYIDLGVDKYMVFKECPEAEGFDQNIKPLQVIIAAARDLREQEKHQWRIVHAPPSNQEQISSSNSAS